MNKKAMGIELVITAILMIIMTIIFFKFITPKLQKSMDTFSLLATNCKYPAFYWDVVSHNEKHAYQFYNEYLNCEFEEGDKTAIIRGYKDLEIKSYGTLNLIKDYINGGNYGSLTETVSGTKSYLDDVERHYRGSTFFVNEIKDLREVMDKIGWRIVFHVTMDGPKDHCKDKKIVDDSTTDPELNGLFIGLRSAILMGPDQADFWNDPDGEGCGEIKDIHLVEFNQMGEQVVVLDEPGFGEETNSGNLKFTFMGNQGKTIFYELELNENVFKDWK